MNQKSKIWEWVLKKKEALDNKAVGLLGRAKKISQCIYQNVLASQKLKRDPLWFFPIPVWVCIALLLLRAWWVGFFITHKDGALLAFAIVFFLGQPMVLFYWTYKIFPDIVCYFQGAFRYLASLYQRSPLSACLLCCCGCFAICFFVFLLRTQ